MTVDTVHAQPITDDTGDDTSVSSAEVQATGAAPPTGATASSDLSSDLSTESADAPVPRRRGRPKGSSARKSRTIELTLTVSGTADGEWQAELKHGDAWITRDLPVAAAAVSRAAKELHEDLAGPIDEVINAARNQQRAKVAALEAELEQARKALAELAD